MKLFILSVATAAPALDWTNVSTKSGIIIIQSSDSNKLSMASLMLASRGNGNPFY